MSKKITDLSYLDGIDTDTYTDKAKEKAIKVIQEIQTAGLKDMHKTEKINFLKYLYNYLGDPSESSNINTISLLDLSKKISSYDKSVAQEKTDFIEFLKKFAFMALTGKEFKEPNLAHQLAEFLDKVVTTHVA